MRSVLHSSAQLLLYHATAAEGMLPALLSWVFFSDVVVSRVRLQPGRNHMNADPRGNVRVNAERTAWRVASKAHRPEASVAKPRPAPRVDKHLRPDSMGWVFVAGQGFTILLSTLIVMLN
jgi:hypothetical protein